MTLRAPPPDHPVHALSFEFKGQMRYPQDVESFTADDILKLPDIPNARRVARDLFDTLGTDPTATGIYRVHLVARDKQARVVLVSFSLTGSWRIRWSFGRFSDPRDMMHLAAPFNRNGTACDRAGPSTTYPVGNLRITCPNCLLGLAAAHNTTPDRLYDEDAAL